MQRWLIGGGVLIAAVVLAVLLIPSPNTGAEIAHAERKVHTPVALKTPTQAPMQQRRAIVPKADQGSANRAAREMRTATTPIIRGPIPRTVEYRKQLATADLTLGPDSRAWNALDRALQSVETRESKDLRQDLRAIDEKLRALGSDPAGYDGMLETQEKLIEKVRSSDLIDDPGVAAALHDAIRSLKSADSKPEKH